MLSIDTLHDLRQAHVCKLTQETLNHAGLDDEAVVLPEGYEIASLERLKNTRFRERGGMITTSLPSFTAYVEAAIMDNAGCFIDPEEMKAVAVLNLRVGTKQGHCDNCAILKMQRTAAYTALLRIVDTPSTQKTIAEWMEDWRDNLAAQDKNGAAMDMKKAISAIRKIDIKSSVKAGSEVQQMRTERTLLESVSAESEHGLPSELIFMCEPYKGLAARAFPLRLSMIMTDTPKIILRIRREEHIQEEMAQEFAGKIKGELIGLPIYIGTFNPKG